MHKEVIKYFETIVQCELNVEATIEQDIVLNIENFRHPDKAIDYLIKRSERKVAESLKIGDVLGGMKEGIRLKMRLANELGTSEREDKADEIVCEIRNNPLFFDELYYDLYGYYTMTIGATTDGCLYGLLNEAVENHPTAIDMLDKRAKYWVQIKNTYEMLWKLNLSFAWSHLRMDYADNYLQEASNMASSFDDYIEIAVLLLKKTDAFSDIPDKKIFPLIYFHAEHCLNKASSMTADDKDKIKRVQVLLDRFNERKQNN